MSGVWDSSIKYSSSWSKNLTDFQSNYLDRGKWVDLIHTSEKYCIEELTSERLRLTLLLFWRDIVNKLSSDTIFKLQLKLNLKF